MAPEPSRLYDMAAAALLAVQTYHGGTLPDRQFVSAGPPVWDCALLAVHVERTEGYEGDVNVVTAQPLSAGAGFAMRAATLAVTLVRCTPAVPESKGSKVSLPSVADEEDAALTLYSDSQRELNALVQAHKAGELGGCRSLAFMDWSVLGPEGGMVAGLLRVRAGLVIGA